MAALYYVSRPQASSAPSYPPPSGTSYDQRLVHIGERLQLLVRGSTADSIEAIEREIASFKAEVDRTPDIEGDSAKANAWNELARLLPTIQSIKDRTLPARPACKDDDIEKGTWWNQPNKYSAGSTCFGVNLEHPTAPVFATCGGLSMDSVVRLGSYNSRGTNGYQFASILGEMHLHPSQKAMLPDSVKKALDGFTGNLELFQVIADGELFQMNGATKKSVGVEGHWNMVPHSWVFPDIAPKQNTAKLIRLGIFEPLNVVPVAGSVIRADRRSTEPAGVAFNSLMETEVHIHPNLGGETSCSPDNARLRFVPDAHLACFVTVAIDGPRALAVFNTIMLSKTHPDCMAIRYALQARTLGGYLARLITKIQPTEVKGSGLEVSGVFKNLVTFQCDLFRQPSGFGFPAVSREGQELLSPVPMPKNSESDAKRSPHMSVASYRMPEDISRPASTLTSSPSRAAIVSEMSEHIASSTRTVFQEISSPYISTSQLAAPIPPPVIGEPQTVRFEEKPLVTPVLTNADKERTLTPTSSLPAAPVEVMPSPVVTGRSQAGIDWSSLSSMAPVYVSRAKRAALGIQNAATAVPGEEPKKV